MTLKVLLYYHFAPVSDVQQFVDATRAFCKVHNLKGRILISPDGINGTCAGEEKDVEAYKAWMHMMPGFEKLWFKEQDIEKQIFPRLTVRNRKELVTLRTHADHFNGSRHLEPHEINKLVAEEGDNVVFFDARNEIESRIGKFKGAICPPIETFKDLPKVLPQYADKLKGKKVVMYCTGGIRCETATDLMRKAVPDAEVYQVNGGIYNYCGQPKNDLWEGSCYVFDDRMQVAWDGTGKVIDASELPEDKIPSHCEFCDCKTTRVVNDERHLERVSRVCCEACDKKNDISRMRTKHERARMFAQRDAKLNK